jgi:hypothetical protein
MCLATSCAAQALSARADARAAVSLQPGLRRLRQNSHPAEILKKNLTPEQCFRAADECGAPIVSIPGGEPLLHPQIGEIVAGLVAARSTFTSARTRFKLAEMLASSSRRSIWRSRCIMDGPREEHDRAVCREGTYDIAVAAIRAAIEARFSRHYQLDAVRGRRPALCANFRPPDGTRRGRHDDLARLPATRKRPTRNIFCIAGKRELFRRLLDRPKKALAIQSVAAVSGVSQGQLGTGMHPVGQSHVQRLRLAEAVLPAGRRTMWKRFRNCSKAPTGIATATPAAIPSARTAWSTAATNRRASRKPLARCAASRWRRASRFSARPNSRR